MEILSIKKHADRFWQNVSQSAGDNMKDKTGRQNKSLMELTSFPFFEIPILSNCQLGFPTCIKHPFIPLGNLDF